MDLHNRAGYVQHDRSLTGLLWVFIILLLVPGCLELEAPENDGSIDLSFDLVPCLGNGGGRGDCRDTLNMLQVREGANACLVVADHPSGVTRRIPARWGLEQAELLGSGSLTMQRGQSFVAAFFIFEEAFEPSGPGGPCGSENGIEAQAPCDDGCAFKLEHPPTALNESLAISFQPEPGMACLASWGAMGAPEERCDRRDNDCDGLTDEAFALGDACTVGVGACERDGLMVCGPEQDDTQCSVRPGAPSLEAPDGQDNDCDGLVDEGGPMSCQESGAQEDCNTGLSAPCLAGLRTCGEDGEWGPCLDVDGAQVVEPELELCDGIDNDCDGLADEDFSPVGEGVSLGQACTTGVGACRSFGQYRCTDDGPLECDAVAGAEEMESCDAVDNDCDGTVDESVNRVVSACGSDCIDCTALYPGSLYECVDDLCELLGCEAGYVDTDGDPSNGCECLSEGDDAPDPEFLDTNCDGLDGDLEAAVFVSGEHGDDEQDCSALRPCETLSAALRRIAVTGLRSIYMAEGVYRIFDAHVPSQEELDGGLQIPSGVSLFGGYRFRPDDENSWDRFQRNEASTVLTGHQALLRYADLEEPTVLANLTVQPLSGIDDRPSSSIGIWAVNVGAHLTLRGVVVEAGQGSDGVAGDPTVANGADGLPGSDAAEPREVAAGGEALNCLYAVAIAGQGGAGARTGSPGSAGESPGAAPGASGGDAGTQQVRNGQAGENGVDGRASLGGSSGDGEGQAGVTVPWLPTFGGTGGAGFPGGGGGGGGGGHYRGNERHRAGAGAGGGGGACPGAPGVGGQGGFGSFGLVVQGGRVNIQYSVIVAGRGGLGGQGAEGSRGGLGGRGGTGAPGPCGACSSGGNGGQGGDGACGGSGGGGAGGPSVAILRLAPPGGFDGSAIVFLGPDGAPMAYEEGVAMSLASARSRASGGLGGEGVGCSGNGEPGAQGVLAFVGCCSQGDDGCQDGDGEGVTCLN